MDANSPPRKNENSPANLVAKANLAAGASPPPICSSSFFTDLISDKTGMSISRLQYVIITFIFMVMFLTTAIQNLKLMDFSPEQLALMGTSAGFYLWNKKLDQPS